MPHISRKKLKNDVAKQIQKQFIVIVSRSKAGGQDALGQLLTETERLMLAKRLAAIVMLAEGMSTYRVCVILKMSPTTTAYLREGLDQGEYADIEKIARRKKEREEFWQEMEVLLRLGMPEMGKGRWKWLDELYPPSRE